MTTKDEMSVEEACAYLAMDESTLTRLATERRIPCFQHNGAWVFSKKSIDKWRSLKERTRA